MQQQNLQKISTQNGQKLLEPEVSHLIKQLIELNRILLTYLQQQNQTNEFFYLVDDLDNMTEIPYKLETFVVQNNDIIDSLKNYLEIEQEGLKLLNNALPTSMINISSDNINIDKSKSFNPTDPLHSESNVSTKENLIKQNFKFSQKNYDFFLNLLFYFVCLYSRNNFSEKEKIETKELNIIKILQTFNGFPKVAERLKVLFQEIRIS